MLKTYHMLSVDRGGIAGRQANCIDELGARNDTAWNVLRELGLGNELLDGFVGARLVARLNGMSTRVTGSSCVASVKWQQQGGILTRRHTFARAMILLAPDFRGSTFFPAARSTADTYSLMVFASATILSVSASTRLRTF